MAVFLYLLREVHSGFKTGQQIASRYTHSKCTLKTSYAPPSYQFSPFLDQLLRKQADYWNFSHKILDFLVTLCYNSITFCSGGFHYG